MSWYLCNACGQRIEMHEKRFHEMYCVNLLPNGPAKQMSPIYATPAEETTQFYTELQNKLNSSPSSMLPNIFCPLENTIQSAYERGQISPNFPTSGEGTIQVNTGGHQNTLRTSTSMMLPDVRPPVNEAMSSAYETGRRQQSVASTIWPMPPGYCPYSSPEVRVAMKNVDFYQAVYENATERSIEAIRRTVESLDTVHEAVNRATAASRGMECLAEKARQLHKLFTEGNHELYFDNIHSVLSKTWDEIRAMSAKEKDALCFFERALIQERDAFDIMLKAANFKHEAFKVALSQHFKKEHAIDSVYLKGKGTFPINKPKSV